MMVNKETWKAIEGTGGRYEVSNMGNIRSLFTEKKKPLRQYVNSSGYMVITIRINGKKQRYQAHRLVAMAFVDNPHRKPFVNHIDSNRTNNHVDNLEWCTNRENILHAVQKGIKFGKPHHEKKVIRSDGKEFRSISAAAREIGVPYSYIRDVLNGRQLSTRGYSFNFLSEGGDYNVL